MTAVTACWQEQNGNWDKHQQWTRSKYNCRHVLTFTWCLSSGELPRWNSASRRPKIWPFLPHLNLQWANKRRRIAAIRERGWEDPLTSVSSNHNADMLIIVSCCHFRDTRQARCNMQHGLVFSCFSVRSSRLSSNTVSEMSQCISEHGR